MKKGRILSKDDESFNDVTAWVEIERDESGYNPMEECDQLFELWSNVPREIGSSKGAECPYEEIIDEDGCGTGKYRIRDGIIAVPVSAYTHSGIHLSVGSIRCMFGDTPDALFLYTYRELWEKLMGKDSWMKVRAKPDDEHDCTLRPATKEEFEDYVEYQAGILVHELNLAEEGSVFGYMTFSRRHYRKIYDDGTEEDCWETCDEKDSCWGFLTDNVSDIDFPRELPVYVDPNGDCRWFVDQEYDIPEFLVTKVDSDGRRVFLVDYTVNSRGECLTAEWAYDVDRARTFISWWQVQEFAQKVIPKCEYRPYENCVEKDKLGTLKEAKDDGEDTWE